MHCTCMTINSRNSIMQHTCLDFINAVIPVCRCVYISKFQNLVLHVDTCTDLHATSMVLGHAYSNEPQGTAYSQYEIAIPASTVGDCFKGIFQLLYGRDVDNTSRQCGIIILMIETCLRIKPIAKTLLCRDVLEDAVTPFSSQRTPLMILFLYTHQQSKLI